MTRRLVWALYWALVFGAAYAASYAGILAAAGIGLVGYACSPHPGGTR